MRSTDKDDKKRFRELYKYLSSLIIVVLLYGLFSAIIFLYTGMSIIAMLSVISIIGMTTVAVTTALQYRVYFVVFGLAMLVPVIATVIYIGLKGDSNAWLLVILLFIYIFSLKAISKEIIEMGRGGEIKAIASELGAHISFIIPIEQATIRNET